MKDKSDQSRQVLNPVAVQRAKARVAARHVLIGRHTTRKYAGDFDADGNPIGLAKAKPTPAAPLANIVTEERRQKLIERRRAAIEANLRAEGKLSPPP